MPTAYGGLSGGRIRNSPAASCFHCVCVKASLRAPAARAAKRTVGTPAGTGELAARVRLAAPLLGPRPGHVAWLGREGIELIRPW
jgi:hypothetical protein